MQASWPSCSCQAVASCFTAADVERIQDGRMNGVAFCYVSLGAPRYRARLVRRMLSTRRNLFVTEDDFRRIALGMAKAVEGVHMAHPDFRVRNRIFATLHHDRAWGMVKLTPDQQRRFVSRHASVFVPEPGAWGRQGYTAVRLDAVDEETLGEAMTLAWRNVAADAARRRQPTKRTTRRPPKRTAPRASSRKR
jgi:hypothetical protein